MSKGQLVWVGTPDGLLADAAGSAWSVTVDEPEFERLRAAYRLSGAIRRPGGIEARLLAATRPHPQAVPVEPTLEEAYLLFIDEPAPAPVAATSDYALA